MDPESPKYPSSHFATQELDVVVLSRVDKTTPDSQGFVALESPTTPTENVIAEHVFIEHVIFVTAASPFIAFAGHRRVEDTPEYPSSQTSSHVESDSVESSIPSVHASLPKDVTPSGRSVLMLRALQRFSSHMKSESGNVENEALRGQKTRLFDDPSDETEYPALHFTAHVELFTAESRILFEHAGICVRVCVLLSKYVLLIEIFSNSCE